MKRSSVYTYIVVLIAIIVIAIAVAAFFILKKKKERQEASVADVSLDDSTSSNGTTLQLGSRGEEVKRLQKFLNTQLTVLVFATKPIINGKEISRIAEDGIFGSETQAAVLWYFGTTSVNTNQF